MDLANKMDCCVCKKPGTAKCGGCGSVSYCSVDHQKEDWKVHKSSCKSFKVVEDPETGMKLWKATRDLKAGTVLFAEDPLFHYPQRCTVCNCIQELCVGCGCLLEEEKEKNKTCSRCKWPVCGKKCAKLPIHAENECKIFAAKKVSPPPAAEHAFEVTCAVGMIRGARLKIQNGKAFEDLLTLSHDGKNRAFNKSCTNALEYLKKLVGTLEFPEADYERVVRVAEINRITLRRNEYIKVGDPKLVNSESSSLSSDWIICTNSYVYNQVSHLTHSCVPNSAWTIGPSPERKIKISTAVAVKKGETLTIAKGYNPENHIRCTRERQKKFLVPRGIYCRCARCMDPTELGTYASAIKCIRCRPPTAEAEDDSSTDGYMLPVNPLDLSKQAKYKCNTCPNTMAAIQIMSRWRQLELESVACIMSTFANPLIRLMRNPSIGFEFVMKKLRESASEFHPNCWYVVESIKKAVEDEPSEVLRGATSPEILASQIDSLNYILEYENKISPGINPVRAMTLAVLASKLALKILERVSMTNRQQLLDTWTLQKEVSREALLHFTHEYPGAQGQSGNFWTVYLKFLSKSLAEIVPFYHGIYPPA